MQVHYQEGSMGNQSGKLQSFFFFFFFENYSITTEKSKFYTLAENVFLLDYSQIFLAQTSVETIINSYSFFALLFFSLFSKKKRRKAKGRMDTDLAESSGPIASFSVCRQLMQGNIFSH